jgi:hypothetical protein
MPTDPKEVEAIGSKLMGIIRQSMKEGKTKDFGFFLGGPRGYMIVEGSALEIVQLTQKYAPYLSFNVQEVLSLDDFAKIA